MTADELLHLSPPKEDHHYELDDGELILVPPTGPIHGNIEVEIVYRLRTFLDAQPLGRLVCGEVGFKLGEYTVRAPDVAFLSHERLRETPMPDRGFYPGAPDLAIEVLSPDDSAGELLRKAGRFIEAGIQLVWIVDPRRRMITVCRRSGPVSLVGEDGMLDGEDVLPGFSCKVAELFPDRSA